MTIGERIKNRRKQLGLTQDEVAAKACTIKQTIYKYESGKVTNIPPDKLEAIAAVLQLTPAELMGWNEPKSEFSTPSHIPSELDALLLQLNESGKGELVRYCKYLVQQSEYSAAAPKVVSISSYRTIRHYFTPAAAGFASPVEGEDFELINDDSAVSGADFCIDVAGDSMAPYIADGERVYVNQNAPLSNFDVGIFYYDGDVFIKQFFKDDEGNVHLLSANPMRTDANKYISYDSGASLTCFGRVLLPKRLPRPVYF